MSQKAIPGKIDHVWSNLSTEGEEETDYERIIQNLRRENEELKSALRLEKEFAHSTEGSSRTSLFMVPDKSLLERNKELEQKMAALINERKQEIEEIQAIRTAMHDMVSYLANFAVSKKFPRRFLT